MAAQEENLGRVVTYTSSKIQASTLTLRATSRAILTLSHQLNESPVNAVTTANRSHYKMEASVPWKWCCSVPILLPLQISLPLKLSHKLTLTCMKVTVVFTCFQNCRFQRTPLSTELTVLLRGHHCWTFLTKAAQPKATNWLATEMHRKAELRDPQNHHKKIRQRSQEQNSTRGEDGQRLITAVFAQQYLLRGAQMVYRKCNGCI